MQKLEKLQIEKIKEKYTLNNIITIDDLDKFYRLYEPNLNRNTLKWRIYHLIQNNVLERIGRGKYMIRKFKLYIPNINQKLIELHKTIQNEFPFAEICIWDTRWLNEFMKHQPGKFNIIIEAEKETAQAIFNFLIGIKDKVFYNPDKNMWEHYLGSNDNIIIIDLISEAPLKRVDNIYIPTLEKILVDIISSMDTIAPYIESEIDIIFSEILNKYSINFDKLLRYSRRRSKQDEMKLIIKRHTNFWQL